MSKGLNADTLSTVLSKVEKKWEREKKKEWELEWEKKHIIRCRDCEYWLPREMYGFDERPHNYCAMHLPEDEYYAIRKNANDFCSWAKRKEE